MYSTKKKSSYFSLLSTLFLTIYLFCLVTKMSKLYASSTVIFITIIQTENYKVFIVCKNKKGTGAV